MRVVSGLPRALLGLVAILVSLPSAAAPVVWGAWTFDYLLTSTEGLKLRDITFQGRTLISSLSFPVMRVFYEDDECGPFADLLGGSVSPIPWADNDYMSQRQITVNGKDWYEIGIRDRIGSYDMYQVYYLSAEGTIDAHVYSKGLQCVVDHVHYPNWRIDLDLDGEGNDQIVRNAGAGFTPLATEFNADASTAINHAWRVRDTTTGLYVDVLPGFADFSIPDPSTYGATLAIAGYANHTVFGRLYRSSENNGWTFGPNTQVPYNNGENINGTDIVLWYEGYLPHTADEGSDLWHSTGVRLVSSLVPQVADTDGDGVPDASDNCTLVANPAQIDSDNDNYGNICDGDLNNNGVTNSQDFVLFRNLLNQPSTPPDYSIGDINGNGVINAQDYVLLRGLLDKPPGPSGLAP